MDTDLPQCLQGPKMRLPGRVSSAAFIRIDRRRRLVVRESRQAQALDIAIEMFLLANRDGA
ncbi:MAG: hypothetical protein JSW21_03775, partial [Gammaproteobacteria bacterium]